MELFLIITVLCYLISSGTYVAYLFFQREALHKWGYYLLVGGFVFHTVAFIATAVRIGSLPAHNLHQNLILCAWTVAGVFLLFRLRFHLKILGLFAAPLTAAIMIAAMIAPREPVQTQEIFNNFWLVLHVISIFIGEAAFALACGVGIFYILQENAIKNKRRGFFFKRLPNLELLDASGYACLVVGFSMLTLGFITGFVYAQLVWGRLWSWDPKEVWSGITWLFYAAMLHARLAIGWRGRKAAVMAIIGFAFLLFTFLGVNFLLQGHHGEFTRW